MKGFTLTCQVKGFTVISLVEGFAITSFGGHIARLPLNAPATLGRLHSCEISTLFVPRSRRHCTQTA